MKLKHAAFFERTMLITIGLSIFAAACKSPSLHISWKNWLLDRAPYALLWGLAICWSLSAGQALKETGRPAVTAFIRRSWLPVLCIVAITSTVFFLVKPELRVLADEAELLAVSKSMAEEARLDHVEHGRWQEGLYIPLLRTSNNIRPFGFPFMVHLLHRLTGFRPANVFAVNFVLLAGILLILYELVRRLAGWVWSATTVSAVLAQPIVLLCATSGGFELFQVFWITASLAAWLYYTESPRSEPRFCLAWMSLITLAHARYESVLFFLIVIPAIFLTKTAPWSFVRRNPVYVLSCVFLLPLLFQRIAKIGYHPPSVSPGAPLWSLENYVQNIRLFADTLLHPRPEWPYNWLINSIGMISIFWLIWRLLSGTRHLDIKTKVVLLSFSAVAILQIIGLTAYAESGLYLAQSSRYFLLGSVILSIAAVFGVRRLLGKKNALVALTLSIPLLFIFLPVARANLLWKKNMTNSEYRFVKGFLDRETLDPRRTMLIVKRPVFYSSLGYGALTFSRARMNPEELASFFDPAAPSMRVFAVQEYIGESLSDMYALPAGLTFERVDRTEDRSGKIWEISELKNISQPH